MKELALAALACSVVLAMILASPSDAIQPTPAFSKVITDSGEIIADRYNEILVVPKPVFAQLSDSTTQACAANGAASNVTLNTNDSIQLVTHSTTTRTHEVIIQKTGVYQIIAVPQIGEASVQADGVQNFWLVKNGVNVPNTNIKTHIQVTAVGDETLTASLNWVGKLNNTDVIYFQQSCTDSDIGIVASSAAVPPATPSVIISIAKLNW